ncbi:HAD family phosphatase [Mediterraneibacter glycyrrhizinilyticus]|nr:Cof-type HAD-IIB family hydrolase [Mediterraneibacter glycyrrhizinilyticus]MBM6855697.1 HAD family phosphatase [Mediterraneibacter glycyrrhizinilyticus]
MIKVIASDMDGTLLGEDHKIAPETLSAIKEACDAGIRFMICTGRNFPGAMNELEGADLTCDYIVGSGAEVRNPRQQVVRSTAISPRLCREIYETVRKYPISVTFCTDGDDYRIGTEEEVEESLIRQIQAFHLNQCRDEIRDTELYQRMKRNTRVISGIEELEKAGLPVYKLFLFSGDLEMLDKIRRELEKNQEIAVSSSFENNLEITDVKAQKGPVLKEYIESLGYTMDEVMALGDSLNDYSMLSMDFGATVAMENAVPEIRRVAKYTTRSNVEFGVAYAIRELLRHQGPVR